MDCWFMSTKFLEPILQVWVPWVPPDRDGGQGEKVLHLRVQQVCHLANTTKTKKIGCEVAIKQDPYIHMCVGEYIYIYCI